MSSVQEVLVQCLSLLRNAKVLVPTAEGSIWLHALLPSLVHFTGKHCFACTGPRTTRCWSRTGIAKCFYSKRLHKYKRSSCSRWTICQGINLALCLYPTVVSVPPVPAHPSASAQYHDPNHPSCLVQNRASCLWCHIRGWIEHQVRLKAAFPQRHPIICAGKDTDNYL